MDITDASPAEPESLGKNCKPAILSLRLGGMRLDGISAESIRSVIDAISTWAETVPNMQRSYSIDTDEIIWTICDEWPAPRESCAAPIT